MLSLKARSISLTGQAVATVALMTGALFLHAQTTAVADNTATSPKVAQSISAPEPIFHLENPASSASQEAYSSSSDQTAGTEVALNVAEPLKALNAMQYGGGRQRYGRPRYRGGNTNADGSAKYDFFIGGGFGMPAGNQFNYAKTSYGFGGGGGRMFNAHVGVNLEFNYDKFGMSSATLTNQQNLYNYYINLYNQQNPSNAVAPISGLDGNNHVWSFTLDPIVNLRKGEGMGAYIVGGGGFYHKVANFTQPSIGEYCDPYYGCYQYQANQIIDHYTSNALGVNAGFGVDYKFSRFSSERLFGEVRYVYIFNQYKPGVTVATASPGNASVYNDFPYNSQRTSYFPIKFGIRF